jgi:hypothetical protein
MFSAEHAQERSAVASFRLESSPSFLLTEFSDAL